jgi:hypothetical protein
VSALPGDLIIADGIVLNPIDGAVLGGSSVAETLILIFEGSRGETEGAPAKRGAPVVSTVQGLGWGLHFVDLETIQREDKGLLVLLPLAGRVPTLASVAAENLAGLAPHQCDDVSMPITQLMEVLRLPSMRAALID